jgi:HSP20 family protein
MYESLLNYPISLIGQFDRLRRDLDDAISLSAQPSSIRSVAAGSQPQINIGRTSNSLEIYAFAPGLDASKIEVTVDRGVLHIAGERTPELPAPQPGRKLKVYTRERPSGRFDRAIALPDDVDPEHVQASYRDGVLQISIARREAALPKRIQVQ